MEKPKSPAHTKYKENYDRREWNKFRSNYKNPIHSPEGVESATQSLKQVSDSGTRYSQSVFGAHPVNHASEEKNTLRPTGSSIVIHLPAIPVKKIRNVFYDKRLVFLKLMAALLLIGGLYLGKKFYISHRNDIAKKSQSSITPTQVFVPDNLPKDYSVASGTQTLFNGALVYSIYTSTGKLITITQQAKPKDLPNDFFKNSESFDTKYGKAYIVQRSERINGYLLSGNTWVLLNSEDASPQEMRQVILSIKPS